MDEICGIHALTRAKQARAQIAADSDARRSQTGGNVNSGETAAKAKPRKAGYATLLPPYELNFSSEELLMDYTIMDRDDA